MATTPSTALILHASSKSQSTRKITKTVRFQDHGQDFIEWDIEDGKVIGCRPFQGSIWIGCSVQNRSVRKGSFLHIRTKSERFKMTVKYPLVKVFPLKSSYVLSRLKLAMSPGSTWVFFRDGDDLQKDPWSAREIRIVTASSDHHGAMMLVAELCHPSHHYGELKRRTVAYSELW